MSGVFVNSVTSNSNINSLVNLFMLAVMPVMQPVSSIGHLKNWAEVLSGSLKYSSTYSHVNIYILANLSSS